MNYELKTEYYQGPLDKLLELIEEKKLEISQVSLAAVTGDFLKYLKSLEEKQQIDSSLLADFLVVASRLILIKSKELLPSLILTEEEEKDIRNLEWGLKIYQEIKKTQRFIKEKWREMPKMAVREFMADISNSGQTFFFPPKNLKKEQLQTAITAVCRTLESFFRPAATIRNTVINLKEKIEEIFKKITEKPADLHNLHSGKDRNELIVVFLAILHLIKEQLIQAEQTGHFKEIQIAKIAKIE